MVRYEVDCVCSVLLHLEPPSQGHHEAYGDCFEDLRRVAHVHPLHVRALVHLKQQLVDALLTFAPKTVAVAKRVLRVK